MTQYIARRRRAYPVLTLANTSSRVAGFIAQTRAVLLPRNAGENASLPPVADKPKSRLVSIRERAETLREADDFEDVFDRFRRNGDLLLLIVGDRVRSSVERLVEWMNGIVGSAPYKLGLIELRFYDVPDGGRVIVPRTLLIVPLVFPLHSAHRCVMVKVNLGSIPLP